MRSRSGANRLLFAFLGCAAIVLGLAACGGGGTSTTSREGETLAAAESLASGTAGSPHRSGRQGPSSAAAAPGQAPGSHEAPSRERPPLGESADPPEGSPAQGRQARGQGTRPSTPKGDGSPRDAPAHSSVARPPLTRASAAAAERAARRRARAAHGRLARQAGAAAPFLVETGDNSIPTYGSEATAAELAAAEAALSAYLSARAAGEWGPACAQIAGQIAGQLGGPGAAGGCPQAYAKLAERIPASARTDPLTAGLTALRVEGPHAFALFYGPGEQQYMMPLEEEAGAWKVTQLEAVPWPIGSTGE